MPNSKIPHVNLTDTLNLQRTRFNQLVDSVGDLGLLITDETSTIVGALNSVDSNVGTRLNLTTNNKTDVVTAINEHDAELGTITSGAMGTTASTVSTAIAELDGRLDSINTNELITPRVYAQDSAATNYFNGKVQMQSNLDVQGNVQIDGTLTVDGVVNFKAGSNGSVTLGDANTDNVVFNADVNSAIIPNVDNAYDLGTASQEWRHAYIDGTANIDNVAADSATIGTLKVSDLTNNRVLVAGVSGEVEDDTNLTFDGTTLSVGSTSINRLAVGINTTGLKADSATITGDLDVQGITTLDEATVDGTLTTTGTATFNSNVVIENDLRVQDSATITGNLRVVGNITSDSRAFFIQADSAGTDQVNFGETIRVRGGEGIDVNRDNSNGWHVVAEKATSSNLGVASFSTDNFTVTDGAVIIKDGGVANAELANSVFYFADSNSSTLIALGSTVTFRGAANEIEVNHVGSTFYFGLPTDVDIDGSLTIGGNFSVGEDLVVLGTLKSAGQYTELLSETLPGATPTLNAGLTINRGNQDSAELIWDEAADYWTIGTLGALNRIVYDNGPADLTQVDMDSARVSGNMSIGGSLVLSGNLTVSGTTTTVDTETINLADNIINLNSNATGLPTQNSGIEIERGVYDNVQLVWNETSNYFTVATDSANTQSRIFTYSNTTTDLTEGSNQYFTTARARSAINAGGNGINYSSATGQITHKDTSAQASVNGTGRTYIQDVGLDSFGHVVSLATATETVVDTNTNQLTVWYIEDADGTEKTVNHNKELKILGDTSHITTNFGAGVGTDVSPYDLTISHATAVGNSTSGTQTLNYGSSFTVNTGLLVDNAGHVDSSRTTTFTLPASIDTTYTAGTGLGLVGTQFQHADTSTQASVNGTGRTYIQDITLDGFGHITGIATATETVVDTNTTYLYDAVASATGAILRLDPSTGANMDVLLKEGSGISINRDSANQITIANTGVGTTYDLLAATTTGGAILRLDPSVGTNDDITLTSSNSSLVVSYVNANQISINHADTSTQASVNGSGRTYIQDITLDTYGHITGLATATETVTVVTNASFSVLNSAGTTLKTVHGWSTAQT